MTVLAAGSGVTLTVVATDMILIDSPSGGTAKIEAVSGVAGSSFSKILAEHRGGRAQYGPFGAGDIKLGALGADLRYSLGSNPQIADPGLVYSAIDANGNVSGLVGPDNESFALASASSNYTIGAYYFPGWSTPGGGPTGPIQAAPWSVIPANRTPLIGQFDETQQSVCDYNMQLARDAGLSFFAYDWYASIQSGAYVPYLDHAIQNHKRSTVPNKPRYCINWAVQTNSAQFNAGNFSLLYTHWIATHFGDPSYLLIDGKPVVMIFDISVFKTSMGSGANVVSALNAARAAAVAAGYPGIHFIGVQGDSSAFWMTDALTHGWDRISSYNTFFKYQNGADAAATSKTGYDRFDDATFGPDEVIAGPTYHSWIGNAGYPTPPSLVDTGTAWVAPTLTSNGWASKDIKLMPQMTSGWDQRPWTYSSTTEALPTAAEFEAHLLKGRAVIDAYRVKTDGYGIITAWNEFGEGSYLMPTIGTGFHHLNAVRRVFGGMRA